MNANNDDQVTARIKTARRLPRGFRRGHDDSLACPHRDVSCCDACALKHPEIVDVVGAHFWVPDPSERAKLAETIDESMEVEGAS
jgi:hypothetical protein